MSLVRSGVYVEAYIPDQAISAHLGPLEYRLPMACRQLTPRSKNRAMNPSLRTLSRQVQRPQHVSIYRLYLVIFTPIHVWTSGLACAVDHAVWHYSVELVADAGSVLHPHRGGVDIFALGLEERLKVAGYPAAFAPDEVA
jgi:hypothetical protein